MKYGRPTEIKSNLKISRTGEATSAGLRVDGGVTGDDHRKARAAKTINAREVRPI